MNGSSMLVGTLGVSCRRPGRERSTNAGNYNSLTTLIPRDGVVSGPSANSMKWRSIRLALRRLLRAWESIQVELQGQYSTPRLHEFLNHQQHTSTATAVVVAVSAPLLCVVVMIVGDIIPLQPTTDPLGNQYGYWYRIFFSTVVVTASFMTQFSEASRALPLSALRTFLSSHAVGVTVCSTVLLLNSKVGFPTPFLFQWLGVLWQPQMDSWLWLAWRYILHANAEPRRDLFRFVWLFRCQVTMVYVYPAMQYGFTQINTEQQTFFSIACPLIKLGFKNWANYGAFRVEDKAPVWIVFTVDIFHALFLSSAMQASNGVGTFLVVATVDICQSTFALVQVMELVQRSKRLVAKIHHEIAAKAVVAVYDEVPCTRRTVFATAASILNSNLFDRIHRFRGLVTFEVSSSELACGV